MTIGILMVSPSYFIRTDHDLSIIEASEEASSLLGLSYKNLIGQCLSSLIKPLEVNKPRFILDYLSESFDVTCTSVSDGFVFVLTKRSGDFLVNNKIDFIQLALDSSEIGVWYYQPDTQ